MAPTHSCLGPTEEWKVIKFNAKYEISNHGRVRTITTGFIRTSTLNTDGYLMITLGRKSYRIHVLVALHFIPNPQNKPEVNHIGSKIDNRAWMLEWATRLENMLDAVKRKKRRSCRAVERVDAKTGTIIATYSSIPEASIAIGMKEDTLRTIMWTKRVTKSGSIWRYAAKTDGKDHTGERWVFLRDSIYPEINVYDHYQVSSHGRAKGFDEKTILTLCYASGVAKIKLVHPEMKAKLMKLSRLVIMGFNVPNPLNKKEVDHVDSDRHNDHLDNLRWATRKENMANKATLAKQRATHAAQATRIRVTSQDGSSYECLGVSKLSEEFGVTPQTVRAWLNSDGKVYHGYTFERIK